MQKTSWVVCSVLVASACGGGPPIEPQPDSPDWPHIVYILADDMGYGDRGDMVVVVDWAVGQIEEALDRLGVAEDTLLIVTSDNGPRIGTNGHASAGELRGYKSHIWEGGHRIPFIARWPGRIEAGAVSDEPYDPERPGQLYNLQEDPGEQTNVIDEQPEIVERLGALLERYREAGRSRRK